MINLNLKKNPSKLIKEKFKSITAKSHTYTNKVNSPHLFCQTYKWWFIFVPCQEVYFVYDNHIYPGTWFIKQITCTKWDYCSNSSYLFTNLNVFRISQQMQSERKAVLYTVIPVMEFDVRMGMFRRRSFINSKQIYTTTELIIPPHSPTCTPTQSLEVV